MISTTHILQMENIKRHRPTRIMGQPIQDSQPTCPHHPVRRPRCLERSRHARGGELRPNGSGTTDTLRVLGCRQISTHYIDRPVHRLGSNIEHPEKYTRRYTNDYDAWAGPLADGSTVAVIINWKNSSRSLTFNLADVGFSTATATDLITGSSLGKLTTSYTATLAAHGSLVLNLINSTPVNTPSFTFYSASSGTLSGGASTRVVSPSGITVVGFVGNGGIITLKNVDGGAFGGTKTLSFDYINGDFVFGNTDCSNCRNAFISINGGSPVQAQMPISAQSWDILLSGYLISLPGFKPGKTNTIEISNANGFTPDFYRVGVSV